MRNFVQPGQVVTVSAPADIVSGQALLVGAMLGIASNSAAAGREVELHVGGGVFEVAKVSAQAWAVGARVYWDDTAKLFTTTASGNTLAGVAVVAAANPSAMGRVRLNGTF